MSASLCFCLVSICLFNIIAILMTEQRGVWWHVSLPVAVYLLKPVITKAVELYDPWVGRQTLTHTYTCGPLLFTYFHNCKHRCVTQQRQSNHGANTDEWLHLNVERRWTDRWHANTVRTSAYAHTQTLSCTHSQPQKRSCTNLLHTVL